MIYIKAYKLSFYRFNHLASAHCDHKAADLERCHMHPREDAVPQR